MTNLLNDPWIPVVRKNGETELITPDKITSRYKDNPIMKLNAPRPDFDGALIQFLIGLLQTSYAPASDKDWIFLLDNPPTQKELSGAFNRFLEAFQLDTTDHPFMQDPSSVSIEDETPIRNLVVEHPASRNLFVKKNLIHQICPICAGHALITFQVNGAASGRGYLTGIRGSNPVTCVIIGDTLWKTIYNNVLPLKKWVESSVLEEIKLSEIFPWLEPIRTCDKNPNIGTRDLHPLHVYWGMSNRFYLNIEKSKESVCDLCGRKSSEIVKSFHRKPYGMSYDDSWGIHPLSPHIALDKRKIPMRMRETTITYRQYPEITNLFQSEKTSPAFVITHYFNVMVRNRDVLERPKLWIFGFDMENAKVRCWYESTMPLYPSLEPEERTIFEKNVLNLTHAADYVLQKLFSAIKPVLSDKVPEELRIRFWSESEEKFFKTLDLIFKSLHDLDTINLIKGDWIKFLQKLAISLYDYYSQSDMIFQLQDAETIVKERRNLIKFTSEKGKKIQSVLGLMLQDSQGEKIK